MIYGMALQYFGIALMGLCVVFLAVAVLTSRTTARTVRKRLRDDYGEKCCVSLRRDVDTPALEKVRVRLRPRKPWRDPQSLADDGPTSKES